MCDGKSGFEKAKRIGLIDNELCTRPNHSFPNLAIMKISAYYKNKGCNVTLIAFTEINPNTLFQSKYDAVFVSKVFSDTETPLFIDNLDFVHKGGSGFYYDKSTPLHNDIEHSFPDYSIYENIPSCSHDYYHKYSIGFITRGCIRKCDFCINRNSNKVEANSTLAEFVDNKRPYVMLLDDNITAYKDFYKTFEELNNLNIPFVFKQGMDFRLLNKKKMNIVWNSNYKKSGEKNGKGGVKLFHFAFDNIADYILIEKRLKEYYFNKPFSFMMFFYVIVGFDRSHKYNDDFYKRDILDLLTRVKLLFKYNAYPYIMLHEDYKKNPNNEVIRQLARICNNPMMITNKTIRKSLEIYSKTSNTEKTISIIEKIDPEFLNIVFNSKMPTKEQKERGDF